MNEHLLEVLRETIEERIESERNESECSISTHSRNYHLGRMNILLELKEVMEEAEGSLCHEHFDEDDY